MSISIGNRRVWVTLVDSSGAAFKDSSADFVWLPGDALVADFRKAVKAEFSNKLSSVDAADLKVYRDAAHFHARNLEGPLKASTLLKGSDDSDEKVPGKSEENALIILVPSPSGMCPWFKYVYATLEYVLKYLKCSLSHGS
jgi:hypothetical protein